MPDVTITRIYDHGKKDYDGAEIRGSYNDNKIGQHMMIVEYGVTDLPKMREHVREFSDPLNIQYERKINDDLEEGSNPKWYGGLRNWQEAEAVMSDGWPEGVAKAQPLIEEVEELIPMPKGRKRKLAWRDQGDELDKARLYSGQIDTMWRATPRQVGPAPRTISIEVAVGGNSHQSAEKLFWCGVGAVVLADALEQAGYRVELWGSHYTKALSSAPNGQWGILNRCRLKEAMEPLRVDTIAALTAHAGIFRSFGFYAMMAVPQALGSNHGSSRSIKNPIQYASELGVAFKPDVLVSNVYSKEDAVKMIKEALERLTQDQDEMM